MKSNDNNNTRQCKPYRVIFVFKCLLLSLKLAIENIISIGQNQKRFTIKYWKLPFTIIYLIKPLFIAVPQQILDTLSLWDIGGVCVWQTVKGG